MQINCTSCGSIIDVNSESKSTKCSFCGNSFSNKQGEIGNNKPQKGDLVNYESYFYELNYINRGLKSILDIIEIYSEEQIASIDKLNLPGNKIKSLIGIANFRLQILDLQKNDITSIDDFPDALIYFHLNLEENKFLKKIDNTALNKINDKIGYFCNLEINLKGCNAFDFEELSKIDYHSILDPCDFTNSLERYNEGHVGIKVDSNVDMPETLKRIGFIKKNENHWQFKFKTTEYIEVYIRYKGCVYYCNKEKFFRIYNELKSNNNKETAIDLANKEFKGINDTAGHLVNSILEDETLFPSDKPKKGCFVATAVMGDYNHSVVLDLRKFRDNRLLKHKLGIRFINWYYTYGPFAARAIEKSILLKLLSYILIVKPLHLLTKKIK